jgi:hypothetical protein
MVCIIKLVKSCFGVADYLKINMQTAYQVGVSKKIFFFKGVWEGRFYKPYIGAAIKKQSEQTHCCCKAHFLLGAKYLSWSTNCPVMQYTESLSISMRYLVEDSCSG